MSKSPKRSMGFVGAAHQALLRSFVGREPALRLLDGMLAECTDRGEPQLLFCLGPGGMGKTTLLQVFAERVRSAGHRVLWLTAGEVEHDVASLERALGIEGIESLGTPAAADLLVLDGLERDPALLSWLASQALPRAGARILLVTTSREAIQLGGQGSALSAIARELRLRPLSDEETVEALARRGVPPKQRAELATLAAGLPRAVAELAHRSRVDRPTPFADRPPHELVDAVAAALLADLPSPLHRQAIEAMAVACALDEPLLLAMLGPSLNHDEAGAEKLHALHAWLGQLTFVVRDVRGLVPHPRVREALHRELEVRDPVRLRELGKRAVAELSQRVDGAGLATRHQHVIEALFAQRSELSLLGPLLEGASQERLRRASERDVSALATMLEQTDPSLLAPLRALFGTHPERVLVLARPQSEPTFGILLCSLADAESVGDPWVDRVREHSSSGPKVLARTFSFRTGEALASLQLAAQVGLAMLVLEDLHAGTLYSQLDEALSPLVDLFGASRLGADGLVAMDIHGASAGPGQPLQRLAEVLSEPLRRSDPPSGTHANPFRSEPARDEAHAPLDEAMLASWVRSALAARHRPHELKKSPLVELLAVQKLIRAGFAPEQALGQLLDESCRALASAPAYESSSRLLELTYLDPSIVKQEAAAAELKLPFGTYRYQLRRALDLVTVEIAAREEETRGLGLLAESLPPR